MTFRPGPSSRGRRPGAVVIAMFDVDGPEHQAIIVDSILDAVARTPGNKHAGMSTQPGGREAAPRRPRGPLRPPGFSLA
ncbi:hypothetical protein FraQA3DRAFT_6138 [Frankia sp. QA3]|nr:hypothetical protein FraQA3DRAFT_6138 [Frankia sp. QA3]